MRQPRQLPTVATWQMPPCHTDLLLDQIEIIKQPRLCRYNFLPRYGLGCHHMIGRQQHLLIIRKSWQQPVRPRMGIDTVLTGQRYRMALELVDAE